MTFTEAISQLEDLKKDRQSFQTGEDDDVFKADEEALDIAIQFMKNMKKEKR